MSDTLVEAVQAHGADSDTVQQTLRYYLARRLDDMTPNEMTDELVEVVGDRARVQEAIDSLSADPMLLENAGFLLLSGAWEESGEAPVIEGVLEDAKGKLPVVEVAILAIAALYGLYLWRTGGVSRSEKTVERKADGSVVERELVEYAPADAPLKAITELFAAR